jgi:hypothetical protein
VYAHPTLGMGARISRREARLLHCHAEVVARGAARQGTQTLSDSYLWMSVHIVDIDAATKMTPDKIERTLSEATAGHELYCSFRRPHLRLAGVPFRVFFSERWLMFTTLENSNGGRNDSFGTEPRTF